MFVPETLDESISTVLKGKPLADVKEYVIESIDKFIEEHKIFKFSPINWRSGPGKFRQEQFLQSLPSKVNAGPNFYYSITDSYSHNNVMNNILMNVYGINTFNINKIMGTVINVPFKQEWVEIKPKETRTYSLFVYLKNEKIILEFYRNKKTGGTVGTDPNKIYFDYDNLKNTLG